MLLLCAGPVFSQDYGLTLRSLPVLTGGDDPVNVEYTGTAVPWFAAPLGEAGDLYLSGGFSAEYADQEWQPVFEAYRFEIAWRFGSGLVLEAGRLPYRDRYFASRRLVFSAGWEIPGFLNTGAKLDLGITGQFDVNTTWPGFPRAA
jgi:hypothetical protein